MFKTRDSYKPLMVMQIAPKHAGVLTAYVVMTCAWLEHKDCLLFRKSLVQVLAHNLATLSVYVVFFSLQTKVSDYNVLK